MKLVLKLKTCKNFFENCFVVLVNMFCIYCFSFHRYCILSASQNNSNNATINCEKKIQIKHNKIENSCLHNHQHAHLLHIIIYIHSKCVQCKRITRMSVKKESHKKNTLKISFRKRFFKQQV